MLETYKEGRTPNPDVLCNRYVKFDPFFNFATETLNADAIATGHYASTSFGDYLENYNDNADVKLLRPVDKCKDQTLFLSTVRQKALRKTMFPLGSFVKPKVKQIARELGFNNLLEKKESMGMCFIGPRNFNKFIDQYLDIRNGECVDVDTGKTIGYHTGVHHFTIGQNIKLGGTMHKYYVAELDSKSNTIFVCNDSFHPAFYFSELTLGKPFWVEERWPDQLCSAGQSMRCQYIFQRFSVPSACEIKRQGNDKIKLYSKFPARAPAPGQFVVFYLDNECLGGAEILSRGPSLNSRKKIETRIMLYPT